MTRKTLSLTLGVILTLCLLGVLLALKYSAFRTPPSALDGSAFRIPHSALDETSFRNPQSAIGDSAFSSIDSVSLRKFPFPYRAALTITSDADSCSRQEYLEVHQFLNTKEDTSKNVPVPGRDAAMGVGVGLELGDSFFPFTDFDNGGWTVTYFSRNSTTPGPDADLLRTWAHAGYIDVLHSFGDVSAADYFKREMAQSALAEFQRAGMSFCVFVNHGGPNNANNIGPKWRGDDPAAPSHHTDLSLFPRGPVRFVSDGSCTTTLGFDPPLRPLTLRDGARAWAFPRYYDPQEGWTVEYLDKQLSAKHLDALVGSEGYWIVANHLGMTRGGGNQAPVFSEPARRALHELEQRHRSGQILVTTAAKLLTYAAVHQGLVFSAAQDPAGAVTIEIRGVRDPVFGDFVPTPDQLQGITFYTSDPDRTRVLLAGRDVTPGLQRNPADHLRRRSIGFPRTLPPPLPEWTSDGYTRKSEDYRIENYTYTFSVANIGQAPFAPTLAYVGLHPFSVREARLRGAYWIYIPDGHHIRLPRLRPGESLAALRVLNGRPSPILPRLASVSGPDVAVAEATHDLVKRRTRVVLEGAGAAALAFQNFAPETAFHVRVNGADLPPVTASSDGALQFSVAAGAAPRVVEITP